MGAIMLRHQYQSNGDFHRIVQLDAMSFLKHAGEWVSYRDIATYTSNINARGEKTYMAVTDHLASGVLASNKIYEVESAMDLDGGSEKPHAVQPEEKTT